MPNMVRAKLTLNSIFGLRPGTHHYAGIVDQGVDFVHGLDHICCSFSDGDLAAKVYGDEFDIDVGVYGVDAVDDGLDFGEGAA